MDTTMDAILVSRMNLDTKFVPKFTASRKEFPIVCAILEFGAGNPSAKETKN